MAHYNIVFATPGHSMTNNYVKSLASSIAFLNEIGLTWTFINQSSSLVSLAREATIENSMVFDMNNNAPMKGEHTYDKIISIDSDISWKPEQLIKLYNYDLDVVSGVYLCDDQDQSNIHLNERPLLKKDFERFKGPFKCDGVGFGFLAIRSGVFESMQRAWFTLSNVYLFSKKDPNKRLTVFVGEDLSWCNRVKHELNKDIWCDPSIRVTHHKTIGITFDE